MIEIINNCKIFVNELLNGKNINRFFDAEEIRKNWNNGNTVFDGVIAPPKM